MLCAVYCCRRFPGAAVTSVRISDVYQEFSPIPGACEDTTQLILNLKQLRMKLYSEEPVRIYVHAQGSGADHGGAISMCRLKSKSSILSFIC